jgi:RNA polymerase sigma-70 factor (ECF subfamily)
MTNAAENAAEVATRPDRFAHDAELRALLAKVAQHDRSAFRCLYHALRPALARHLHRQLPRADLVEELLNDVMYVVWQNAGSFRGDAQVTTWVLGIATMKSHRARQRWRREQVFIDHPEISEDASASDDAHTDRDLEDGLAQLSHEHRDTLELTYYFGYSCAEVAQLRGCPVGTVKTRLFHARRRLKQFLDQCVGEVS